MRNDMLFKKFAYLTLSAVLLAGCIDVESEIPVKNTPVLSASVVTADITRTSATIHGSITGNGTNSITEFGFDVAGSNSMIDGERHRISGSCSDFSYHLEGLESGKTYFFQTYASNGHDVIMSTVGNFQTLTATAPTLEDFKIEREGTVYMLSASVTDYGGSDITEVGFVWDDKTGPTTASRVVEGEWADSDHVKFKGSITGDDYSPGITYFVKAYVDYDLTGTGSVSYTYSDELTFQTDAVKPTVETADVDISKILSTTAELGGNVVAEGGVPVTEKGILVSRDSIPDISNAIWYPADQGGAGAFTVQVTDLEIKTRYYFRAYAENEIGIAYGEVKEFETEAVRPTVETLDADDSKISSTTAELGGFVSAEGGVSIIERGIVVSIQNNPDINNSTVFAASQGGVGAFTVQVTDLEIKTKYYFRAYAKNEIGIAYGEVKEFETDAVRPTVETADADAAKILSTTAELGGNVVAEGGIPVTERGILISRQSNPDISNATAFAADRGGPGAFTVQVTDMEIKTKYYFRAYAENDVGLSYGEIKEFTTLEGKPVVVTKEIIRTTGVSATINGNVTDGGTTDVTDRGVVWSTSASPTLANSSKSADTAGTGSFDVTISENLVIGTTYYVRAYATNSSGTSYGEDLTFQLKGDTPKLSLNTPDNITASTANVSASITNDYGMSIMDKGFVWSSFDRNPTYDSHNTRRISVGSGSEAFSATIDELEPGTVYYVRAYAINTSGEGYSSVQAFTSSNTEPVVVTSEVISVEETRATVGGVVTNNGGEEVTEHGVFYGTSTDPVKTGTKFVIPGDRDNFSRVLDKLERNTTYYVVAYAKNRIGTGYGESTSFRTKMERPAVTTGEVTDITLDSAKCSAEVTSAGGGTVLERGIVCGTASNPDLKTGTKFACESAAVGKFSCQLNGLLPNTVYFVRAYVTNQDWSEDSAVYGVEKSFMTDSNGSAEDWKDNEYEW